MRADSLPGEPVQRRVPSLLAWQVHFLGHAAGIFALAWLQAALAAAALVYAAAWSFRGRPVNPLIFALAFAAGLANAHWRLPETPRALEPTSLAAHDFPGWMVERDKVLVRGRVAASSPREGGRLRLILEDVTCTGLDGSARPARPHALPGRLSWTWMRPGFRPLPGQTVEVAGRVFPLRGFENPGIWNYRFYWQRQGVFWRMFSFSDREPVYVEGEGDFWPRTRGWMTGRLLAAVPDTQGGALLRAVLAGDRMGLSHETRDTMTAAGLSHTLALSGLHVGVVAGLGLLFAHLAGLVRPGVYLRLPRPRLAVVLAAPLVAGYVWLGGGSPSLLRAGLMFAGFGFLLLMGRSRVILDGLALALVVILALDPLGAFDLGLQMSAVAVAGIALLWPWCNRLLGMVLAGCKIRGRPAAAVRYLLVPVTIGLAANLALLPLVMHSFGQVSGHIYCNLIWLPVMGAVIMPLGFAGFAMSLVPGLEVWASGLLGGLGSMVDAGLWCLESMHRGGLVDTVAGMRPTWPVMAGYWLFLVWILAAVSGRASRPGPGVLVLAVALLSLPAAGQSAARLSSVVRLTMLDVGQGQAVVIETREGRRWLVDGGGTFGAGFDIGEAVVGAFLTHGRPAGLEGAVLSHCQTDHGRGLIHPVKRFGPGWFASTGRWQGAMYMRRLQSAVAASKARVLRLAAGDALDLGHGLVLEVLHPARGAAYADENDNSLVLRLVRNGQGLALLPGDLEAGAIRDLLAGDRELDARVLVVAHHGSASSLVREFYERVDPDLALVSAGFLNRYGFPDPDVVRALEAVGARVLSTSRVGAIQVAWPGDDGKPWVQTALPPAGAGNITASGAR
jgi:competence protein ComEC